MTRMPRRWALWQRLAEGVTARRQVRAAVVELDLGGVMGDDAAAAEQQRIGREVGDLPDQAYRVETGVDLPEVGLDQPHRLVHPPAAFLALGWHGDESQATEQEDAEDRMSHGSLQLPQERPQSGVEGLRFAQVGGMAAPGRLTSGSVFHRMRPAPVVFVRSIPMLPWPATGRARAPGG